MSFRLLVNAAILSGLTLSLTGCDVPSRLNSRLPSTPTSQPVSPSPGELPTVLTAPVPSSSVPPPGQISLLEINPSPGAILLVRDCTGGTWYKNLCTSALSLIVGAEFNRDVSNAVVTAGFYRGSQRSGISRSDPVSLSAGNRASFAMNVISISDEVNPYFCQLPAETTRIVVQLWERSSPIYQLLSQEFSQTYIFSEP
jgi:hypothetical protein